MCFFQLPFSFKWLVYTFFDGTVSIAEVFVECNKTRQLQAYITGRKVSVSLFLCFRRRAFV